MSGTLAVDFGTSNTVVAQWDASLDDAVSLHLPEVGRHCLSGEEQISVVPSLIHYSADRQRIGNQVLQDNLYTSPGTFRAMKRYIGHRSPVRRRLGDGREISHFDAGRDFLRRVLEVAAPSGEEVALTVPVEAFEHYDHWLTEVAEGAGLPRIRLLDEPSAAALGYRTRLQPGDVYVIFDFGGGTLDVSVIMLEEDGTGRRCRVLGKAGAELGGVVVDQWLFAEVLRREGRRDSDEDVRPVGRALLVECERVKEQLSSRERADLSVVNPETGSSIYAEFSRAEFEALLEEHEAFTTMTQTVRRAMAAAQERGYGDDHVKAVLMVGGSSLIPSVQRTVHHLFGRDRVSLDRPLDAVARGAAVLVAGHDFYDHIQHDYAIRYVTPSRDGYEYKTLVRKGTPYPTRTPVSQLTIKASSNGQAQLGLAIFEVSEKSRTQAVELVFDPSGAPRLTTVTSHDQDARRYFWMNEKQPTFLRADPPGQRGEPRFRVSFSVDANKRLTITAVDLLTQKLVYEDYPVVKLT